MSPAASSFRLLLCALLWLAPLRLAVAAPDRIHLRNGQRLTGTVLRQLGGNYLFQQAQPGGPASLQRIPKTAVTYVVYGDSAKAAQTLGLENMRRRLCRHAPMRSVHILPTQAFGEAIVQTARQAAQSIWLAAYYLRAGGHPRITTFYDTLRQKAREGVDVVLIGEFSTGTPMPIRHQALNFAQDLAADGIRILFVQGRKVQHKKMLIIDKRLVLLGSSNLTTSGIYSSSEMNVQISEPRFVSAAVRDFKKLAREAKPPEELTY